VSRESVRIVLIMVAVNNLEVKAADIQNAYLTAPVPEKIWTRLGPKFGSDSGKIAIILRAFCMASRALAHHSEITSLASRMNWDLYPARPMPTSGSRPKQDPEMGSSTRLLVHTLLC
jgi:hypothetical protein